MIAPPERAPRNNLDALRMIGAFLVIYGHCYALKGMPERHFLSWLPLGPLGVYIFFTISGYLVVDSWRRDPNLWRFAARRSLRIFPGLAVCVLLSAFVLGPILTPLPLRTYFTHSQVTDYLANIALDIHYSLPLVFATNPYPHIVNGSLWSLPVEFAMYVIVALVGAVRGNRWAWRRLRPRSACSGPTVRRR
jgi:peptidoglycan/LPS O-acetylase OafA/YrhL